MKKNKVNNYNKEEHIQFIESLIKTEQVAVFINNMNISEQSKAEQDDTLEYLYNRIIELQNNWNELKKWLEECLNEIKQNDVYDRTSYENGKIIVIESVSEKMQELEQGKDE